VDKVWGRRDLSPWFPDVPPEEPKLGEIWYERPGGADAELLVKYLFTSEKLSVQVHPDDDQARAAGHVRGKEEAWLILDAAPDACVGLGTVRPLSSGELRAAALDGSIEGLIDWKPVEAGQFIYSPAKTVHAIGPGVTLVEVQQNIDLTYRLYDYGRPRELHLDDGVAASVAEPFKIVDERRMVGAREILCEGRKFVTERLRHEGLLALNPEEGRPVWLTVLAGSVAGAAVRANAGEAVLVGGPVSLTAGPGSDLLLAYDGAEVAEGLLG
jgi:mannose-6-phosphate isomerase